MNSIPHRYFFMHLLLTKHSELNLTLWPHPRYWSVEFCRFKVLAGFNLHVGPFEIEFCRDRGAA